MSRHRSSFWIWQNSKKISQQSNDARKCKQSGKTGHLGDKTDGFSIRTECKKCIEFKQLFGEYLLRYSKELPYTITTQSTHAFKLLLATRSIFWNVHVHALPFFWKERLQKISPKGWAFHYAATWCNISEFFSKTITILNEMTGAAVN